MNETDVLVVHAELIAAFSAGGAELEHYIPSRVGACILDLAAEVRALRENEVYADTEYRDLHIRELRARVAELETILALSGEATIPYQTTSATHVAALEAARKGEP